MITFSFSARAEPLAPCAVLACGETALRLVERLRLHEDDRLARLRGVSNPQLVLVLGAADDLPWVDGVSYLGRDSAAPRLLLPTTLAPNVPPALLERAVALRAQAKTAAPWAVHFSPALVISTAEAHPLTRASLERWAQTSRARTSS